MLDVKEVDCPTNFELDDDMIHVVCKCSLDVALCGKNMTNRPWADGEEIGCVVCAQLDDLPCGRCGIQWLTSSVKMGGPISAA